MVQSSCRFSARGARPLRTALGAALILLLTTCGHKSPTAPSGPQPPAAPTGLKVTNPTSSSLTAHWSSSSGATGYELYRDSVQGGAFRTKAYTGPDTLFTDSTLNAGTTYYYKVRATSAAGHSLLSLGASGTTVPGVPANLKVWSTTAHSLKVSWSGSRGATNYELYRDTAKDGVFQVNMYTGPNTSFTDSTLQSGTTYYYEVTASDAGGRSPRSAAVGATPLAAPANLKVTAPMASSLTLSWSAVAGATGYEIHRDTTRTGSFQTVAYTGPDTLFTDTALAVSTTYYYEAMATDSTDKSVPSAVASGTTIPISVTLSPASASDTIGHTMQFAAHVTGSPDTTVYWYVNSVRGGSSGLGTIDSTGLYKAPESPPSPASVSVRAVSAADTSKSATATVTIIGATTQPMLVWTAFSPVETSCCQDFRVLTVDKAGDPIAAGTVKVGGSSFYATVFSTDSLGRVRWSYTSTTQSMANAIALAPDSTSVLVAGNSGGPSASAVPLLFEVDSGGSETHEGTCPTLSESFWSLGRAGGYYDLLVGDSAIVTADLAGNPDCTNLIDGAPIPPATMPWGIRQLVPFGGDLYEAGSIPLNNQYWTNGAHVYVQQVNGSAQPVWRTSLDSLMGPPVTDNGQMGLTVANEAGTRAIYLVVGQIDDSISGNLDWQRYRTVKFDAEGNILWSRLWNGDNTPESDETYPYAVIPDPHGGIIFAGMGSENGSIDWTCNVASYTSDGSLRWGVAPAWNVGGTSNECSAVALNPDGRFLYVGGATGGVSGVPEHMFIAKFALPPG